MEVSDLNETLLCPIGHLLRPFENTINSTIVKKGKQLDVSFECDVCKKVIQKYNKRIYGCRECDYDLCQICMMNIIHTKIPSVGHEKLKINPLFLSIEHRRLILMKQIKGISLCRNEILKTKGIKFVLCVINNILQNLSNPKYQDLNFKKIESKLRNAPTFINVLFTLGFERVISINDNYGRLRLTSFYMAPLLRLMCVTKCKLSQNLIHSNKDCNLLSINLENNCLLFIVYAYARSISNNPYPDVVRLIYSFIGGDVLIIEENKTIRSKKPFGVLEYDSIILMKNAKLTFDAVWEPVCHRIKCYNNLILEQGASICTDRCYYDIKRECGADLDIQVYGKIIFRNQASITANGGLYERSGYYLNGDGGDINIAANDIVMNNTNKIQSIGGKGQRNGKVSIMIAHYSSDSIPFIEQNTTPKPLFY